MNRIKLALIPLVFACSDKEEEVIYESPCGYEDGEGTAVLEGLEMSADYPDSGIEIGIMGRACVEPDVGWSGYLVYYQRQSEVEDPAYFVGSVWEISTTTVNTDCTDCEYTFATDEATGLARVGDESWNKTEFLLQAIGVAPMGEELPLIYHVQEGQGFASVSVLGEYTLEGEIDDSGDYFDYTFDQYGMYY